MTDATLHTLYVALLLRRLRHLPRDQYSIVCSSNVPHETQSSRRILRTILVRYGVSTMRSTIPRSAGPHVVTSYTDTPIATSGVVISLSLLVGTNRRAYPTTLQPSQHVDDQRRCTRVHGIVDASSSRHGRCSGDDARRGSSRVAMVCRVGFVACRILFRARPTRAAISGGGVHQHHTTNNDTMHVVRKTSAHRFSNRSSPITSCIYPFSFWYAPVVPKPKEATGLS